MFASCRKGCECSITGLLVGLLVWWVAGWVGGQVKGDGGMVESGESGWGGQTPPPNNRGGRDGAGERPSHEKTSLLI